MKVRRVGADDLDGVVAVRLAHDLADDEEIVLHRDWSSTDGVAKPPTTHQTRADEMASTLPEELVEEILLRVPPDEPAHLVHATVVCKAWRRILSDDTFRRRYCRFHGTAPLLGYIYNNYDDSTIQFVATTSVAAFPLRTPPVLDLDYYSGTKPLALDCRHGRVLSEAKNWTGSVDILIVWDPISGGQQILSMPSYYLDYPYPDHHAGAVLCGKEGCDHLDCHGGPFLVVFVGSSCGVYDNDGVVATWASVYSSEIGAWSALTDPIITNHHVMDRTNHYVTDRRPSLLIGDALYFTTKQQPECVIIKYDLCKHGLSVISSPEKVWPMIIMKADDGGLGVAALVHSCIHMWSWQAGNNGIDHEWVKYRVMKLDAQILKGGWPRGLICTTDCKNTIFFCIGTGIFMIDLKSGLVRKIGRRHNYSNWRILPYMSFFTRKC